MSDLYKLIYEQVKKIPYGQVSTYGEIALKTGNPRRSRIVGYAMASCNDSTIQCHRVVYKNGRLSKFFGGGGQEVHRERLEQEGIKVSDEYIVDLKQYLWIEEI